MWRVCRQHGREVIRQAVAPIRQKAIFAGMVIVVVMAAVAQVVAEPRHDAGKPEDDVLAVVRNVAPYRV